MGRINAEVEGGQLAHDPRERPILEFFLSDFDVTWGGRRFGNGTALSIYLLRPAPEMQELFGFTGEILLLYSSQPTVQARALQLCDKILSETPANGRADPLVVIFVSVSQDFESELATLMTDNRQTRIYIPFRHSECINAGDAQLLRRRLQQHLFSRDLFDVSQPISSDLYFFGRKSITVDLRDSIRSGENTGLFGLRKTGKTSVLLRLQRMMGHDGRGKVVYLDLQDQALYSLRWWELLDRMRKDLGSSGSSTEATGASLFRQAVIDYSRKFKNRKTVFALDEIEHISPGLSMQPHWKEDFLHLWKTLRAIQNQHRSICFLVCGVNASCIETPTYDGHDNPLFSMAKIRYMPPFEVEDVANMTRTLGRVMGMHFATTTNQYLKDNFGGHPLLIRMACSWVHRQAVGKDRPFSVGFDIFAQNAKACSRSLFQWASHILGMLNRWYPDEYHMLECLAKGNTKTFEEFAEQIPQSVEHLKSYSLLADNPARLTIPFLADFLKSMKASAIIENKAPANPVHDVSCEARNPSVHIEVNMRDKVQVNKGIAVAGNAHVHDFNQAWKEIESETKLVELADGLARLRTELKKESSTVEQDAAVGAVASAESAARAGNGPEALKMLGKLGTWVLGVATKIGIPIAVSAIKHANGLD